MIAAKDYLPMQNYLVKIPKSQRRQKCIVCYIII